MSPPFTLRCHLFAVDPGVSGGVARFIDRQLVELKPWTGEREMARWTMDHYQDPELALLNRVMVLEQVFGSPVMGPASAFTFGANYGFWHLLGLWCAEHLMEVRPQEWQRHWLPSDLGLRGERRKDHKAALLSLAKKIDKTATYRTADALLLGRYIIDTNRCPVAVVG